MEYKYSSCDARPARAISLLSACPSGQHLHTPTNILDSYHFVHGEKYHHDEPLINDITDVSFFEGIYLLLLSGAGVSLGYLASSLSWPANFAPLFGLSVLLYLIATHRSALTSPSPLRIRLPMSQSDEEALLALSEGELSEKVSSMALARDAQLRMILAQKRKGALAGVYAFGDGAVWTGEKGDAGAQVWVVVEDMDA